MMQSLSSWPSKCIWTIHVRKQQPQFFLLIGYSDIQEFFNLLLEQIMYFWYNAEFCTIKSNSEHKLHRQETLNGCLFAAPSVPHQIDPRLLCKSASLSSVFPSSGPGNRRPTCILSSLHKNIYLANFATVSPVLLAYTQNHISVCGGCINIYAIGTYFGAITRNKSIQCLYHLSMIVQCG